MERFVGVKPTPTQGWGAQCLKNFYNHNLHAPTVVARATKFGRMTYQYHDPAPTQGAKHPRT